MSYNGRRFRAVAQSPNGEVSGETVFQYRQEGSRVWATYEGGNVRNGHLIATVDDAGALDMRYHHISGQERLMTGTCRSVPEMLPDGRLRLHEEWQWTSGDLSQGHSIVEQIPE